MRRKLLELIWAVRRRLAEPNRAPAPAVDSEDAGGRALEWSTTFGAGDESIGYGYLERWRRSGRALLSPAGDEGASLRLFSHDAPGTPPATRPHVTVEARNLVIDFGRIGTRDELESRPGYLRVRGGYSDFRPGALLAAGTPAGDLGPDLFPRDHLRDIFQSLQTTTDPPDFHRSIEEVCLLVSREPREYENLFHAHTDWLSVYFAIRLLGLEHLEKRVVLLDPHRPGALDGGFTRLFSPAEPLFSRRDFGSARVRFRHAVFVPPGYSSVLWARQHDEAPGPPVGLLQDYGAFFRSAYCPRSLHAPDQPVRLTLLARRPYPGRGPVLLRQFRSEAVLADALRNLPGLAVDILDPAALPLTEQVRTLAATEILVGGHGAGLAHAFAMADHGAVVEIVAAPAASTYRLYANLAAWTDRLYARIEAPELLGWSGSRLDPDPEELRRCVLDLAARVLDRRPRAVPNPGGTSQG